MSGSDNIVNIHFNENRERQGLTFHEDEQQVDKSRKGSVDERILSIVEAINRSQDFFTTSTCSGRAILFTHDAPVKDDSQVKTPDQPSARTQKKGCQWLFVTHDNVVWSEFRKTWDEVAVGTNAVLKIEPSIFHIQCRDLKTAKRLVHVATESGFRNSGMVVGKDNKITVAVRSAIGMEVPLKKLSDPLFSNAFLQQLIDEGNGKLDSAWGRTKVFTENFLKEFSQ